MYYNLSQVVLKGHITAAALHYFNMKSVDDHLPPQVIGDLKQSSKQQRKIYFNRIVRNIIESVVRLPNNPGYKTAADDQRDGVLNYAREVLTYSLLLAEFDDAIKEGDGPRVITCWKFFLLIFKASNRTKYALEAVTLLINLQVLPERIQQQMIWSRFVNPSGQAAQNEACDLHMEHLNRTAKDALGQHSHLNPKSVTRVGKCVGLFRNARKQFDTVTDVHHSIGKHVRASAATDLSKITKQLVESQVFRETSNRSHDSFVMKGLTDSINHKKFIEWLSTHIHKVQARHQNIN